MTLRISRLGVLCSIICLYAVCCFAQTGSGWTPGSTAKFRWKSFRDTCLASRADRIERVAVMGRADDIVAMILKGKGTVTATTASVVTGLVDVATILRLAESPSVVSIVWGWKKFAAPLRHSGEEVADSGYRPLPVIPVDSLHRRYAVRTGDLDAIRTMRAPLRQRYDGSGVLVGVIENGLIDFRHPDFLNADGTTRFVSIWDQSRSVLPSPHRFGYGMAWRPDDLNREIRGETHYFTGSPDANDHITRVAGVAVGNGHATGRYCGVAPGARLINVSILPSEANLIEAVRYIYAVADSLGLPCVINMSMEIAQDMGDGSNIASVAVSEMVREKPGRAFVTSAGNNAHIKRHVSYPGRERGKKVQYWLRPSPGKFQFTGRAEYSYTIRAAIADLDRLRFTFGAAGYDSTEQIIDFPAAMPSRSLAQIIRAEKEMLIVPAVNGNDTLYTITASTSLLNDTTVAVELKVTDKSQRKPEPARDSIALITISMDDPSSAANALRYLLRIEVEGPGRYDAWSEFFLYQVGEDYFDHPITFPSNYLFADAEQTICAPGNGEAVLAAGAYCNQTDFVNSEGKTVHRKVDAGGDSAYPGRLYTTTQPGGLRNGWWKPVAVAPGIGVAAAVPLGFKPSPIVEKYPELAEQYETLEGGLHGIGSGTSCAAPILTGAVALFLQKHPKATFDDIRRALAETSYADAETGPVPNSRAGYGKLDIYGLLCWPGESDQQASSK